MYMYCTCTCTCICWRMLPINTFICKCSVCSLDLKILFDTTNNCSLKFSWTLKYSWMKREKESLWLLYGDHQTLLMTFSCLKQPVIVFLYLFPFNAFCSFCFTYKYMYMYNSCCCSLYKLVWFRAGKKLWTFVQLDWEMR